MTAHPGDIDTLDPCWNGRFFTTRIHDSAGQAYALSTLCGKIENLSIIKK